MCFYFMIRNQLVLDRVEVESRGGSVEPRQEMSIVEPSFHLIEDRLWRGSHDFALQRHVEIEEPYEDFDDTL